MNAPTVAGRMIAELMERGVTVGEIAEKLGVKSSAVSHVKAGRGPLADDKLAILAEMHRDMTPEEAIAFKWLEWVITEKGVKPAMLKRCLFAMTGNEKIAA